MEIMRQVVRGKVAVIAIGIPLHRGKSIGATRHHEAGLAGGDILNRDLEAMGGIGECHDQLITRIHEKRVGVGRHEWPEWAG